MWRRDDSIGEILEHAVIPTRVHGWFNLCWLTHPIPLLLTALSCLYSAVSTFPSSSLPSLPQSHHHLPDRWQRGNLRNEMTGTLTSRRLSVSLVWSICGPSPPLTPACPLRVVLSCSKPSHGSPGLRLPALIHTTPSLPFFQPATFSHCHRHHSLKPSIETHWNSLFLLSESY